MRRWVWIGLTSLLVLGGVGALFVLQEGSAPDAMGEAPGGVRAEFSYYVLLPVIETAPTRANGKGWDTGGSAPDIYYEVHWQGHRVFKSKKKTNTLLAKWSNVSIGPGDLLDSISIDDSIKAARITARPGDTIEFKVFDDDLAGDDLIGAWNVAVETLKLGDQRWEKPAGQLVHVICRVLPIDKVKLEALTK